MRSLHPSCLFRSWFLSHKYVAYRVLIGLLAIHLSKFDVQSSKIDVHLSKFDIHLSERSSAFWLAENQVGDKDRWRRYADFADLSFKMAYLNKILI